MATLLTHPLMAAIALPWLKTQHHSRAVFIIGMLLTLLPDADVIGFRFGIPYEHWLGHRGLSHSLFFAAVVSLALGMYSARGLHPPNPAIALFYFFCLASHGLLDAMTNGGLGVAFFAPFSAERYFFPYRPIDVASLSIKRFFTADGLVVLKTELLYIWLPGLTLLFARKCLVKSSV